VRGVRAATDLRHALSAGWLAWRARGRGRRRATGAAPGRAALPAPAGPWTRAERTLLPVFVVVGAALDHARHPRRHPGSGGAAWLRFVAGELPEPAVPLLGALVLFALPAASGAGRARILEPGPLRRLDWSTAAAVRRGPLARRLMFENRARALDRGGDLPRDADPGHVRRGAGPRPSWECW